MTNYSTNGIPNMKPDTKFLTAVARFRFLAMVFLAAMAWGCSENKSSEPVSTLKSEQVSNQTLPTTEKSADYRKLLADPRKKLVRIWKYPGGEMDEAEMYFWNNGLLVVTSEIFLKKKGENYFLWSLSKDGRLLSITYADERISFQESATTETYFLNRVVESIDMKSKTITYIVDGGIYFNNWLFSGEPIANH
jgi:hypothetical protein